MFFKTGSTHRHDKLLVPVTCMAYEWYGRAMAFYMANTETRSMGPLLTGSKDRREQADVMRLPAAALRTVVVPGQKIVHTCRACILG